MRKNDLDRRKKLEKERKTVTKVIGKKEDDWDSIELSLYIIIIDKIMIEVNSLEAEGFSG